MSPDVNRGTPGGRVLEISGIRVDYPEVVAVDNLSLAVNQGDAMALIGPNGAGKTTVMRAAAGLQQVTWGSITVCGHDAIARTVEARRRTGFMPDFSPVYEALTCAEYLEHFARAYEVPNRGQRVQELLDLVSLQEKANAACAGLSRGMKQRLLFAKSLLHDPDLLILDEPASGLDPIGRAELRRIILLLRDAGKAILISSHILSELSEFCNAVCIMERGRLVKSGPIGEIAGIGICRRVAVKWRYESTGARHIIGSVSGVRNLDVHALGANFDFEGASDDLDDLVKALVNAGIRIVEWRLAESEIEMIFLRSGAKELQ